MKKYTLNTPMPVIEDGKRKVLKVGATISLDETDIETKQMLDVAAITLASDDDADGEVKAVKTPPKK